MLLSVSLKWLETIQRTFDQEHLAATCFQFTDKASCSKARKPKEKINKSRGHTTKGSMTPLSWLCPGFQAYADFPYASTYLLPCRQITWYLFSELPIVKFTGKLSFWHYWSKCMQAFYSRKSPAISLLPLSVQCADLLGAQPLIVATAFRWLLAFRKYQAIIIEASIGHSGCDDSAIILNRKTLANAHIIFRKAF